MALKKFSMQLQDQRDGTIIQTSGGQAQVCAAGSASKVALTDKDGVAVSNPVSLNNGLLTFYTQDTVASVDLYIMAPGGQFVTRLGVTGSGPNEINIDRNNRHQVAMIPFSIADSVAATEKDTGFDLPVGAMVLPDAGVFVQTLEAAKTIDIGLLSSESGGDADGFMVAIPVSAAGAVLAKSASTATRGALIGGGTLDRGAIVSTAVSISYTLSSGTTVAKGFAIIPYQLPIAA